MKEKIKEYFVKLIKILQKPEMAILPANIAFNLILALIPLLTIIVLIASEFAISIDSIINLIQEIIPAPAGEAITQVISGKGFDSTIGISNILAFIFATNGTYAVINASDSLYKCKNTDFIKKRISAVILLLIVIILFLFILIVPIFGENIIELMNKAKLFSKYSSDFVKVFNIMKWPISLFIVYVNLKLIYTIAPSKNIKSKETTIGAIFTTIVWLISVIVFKFYLNHFAHYDILYGNLSNIIILMVWIYFISFIFVLGMAINASKKEEEEYLEETRRIALMELQKQKRKMERKEKRDQRNKKKN